MSRLKSVFYKNCFRAGCVSRLYCLHAMADDRLPPELSFLAAQLLDTVRHVDNGLTHVPLLKCMERNCCNYLQLANDAMHVNAMDLSFFSSLSDVETSMNYIISKSINQRCQGRMLSKVILRCIKEEPSVHNRLQALVLCSLLGNYEFSTASSRPGPAARARLFQLLGPPPPESMHTNWLMRLVSACPVCIMWCLREQVVFAVLDQPAVQQQIDKLVQFDKFREIVSEATNVLRLHVGTAMLCEESPLYESTLPGADPAKKAWVAQICYLMQPYDAALLRISYRRPKQTFRQFLLSVGNKSSGSETEVAVTAHVSYVEIKLLQELAERLVDRRCSALIDMVRWLDMFGLSQAMIDFVLKLMHHHQTGVTSLDKLKTSLSALNQHSPRTFQLLYTCAELIQDTHKIRLLAGLDLKYIANQMQTCQSRLGLTSKVKGPGAVLDNPFFFVYCSVCFKIYSMIVDFDSVYKQDYQFGLRDAPMDYQSGKLYCHMDRHNYRGSCRTTPLSRLFVLGRVLQVNGSMVMMCPQVNCGRLMMVSSKCATTPRGRACCYCTQATSASYKSMLQYYTHFVGVRKCLRCSVAFRKTADVYVYPYRVYVCRKHNSSALMQHMKHWLDWNSESDFATEQSRRNAMEQKMIEVIDERDKNKRLHAAQRQQAAAKSVKFVATVTRARL